MLIIVGVLLAIASRVAPRVRPEFAAQLVEADRWFWNFRTLLEILSGVAIGAGIALRLVRAIRDRIRQKDAIAQRCYSWRTASHGDSDKICQMGHEAYRSDAWSDGVEGRLRYIRSLRAANPHVFYVLEYDEANGSGSTIVGYTAILPLRGEAYDRYVEGAVDQYLKLTGSDVVHLSEQLGRQEGFGLYVQAVFTHPDHRDQKASISARFSMVCEQIATLLQCFTGKTFFLAAEEFDSDGQKLMSEYGFTPTGCQSPRNHQIWTFVSNSPQLPELGKLLVREINRQRRLMKREAALSEQHSESPTLGKLGPEAGT